MDTKKESNPLKAIQRINKELNKSLAKSGNKQSNASKKQTDKNQANKNHEIKKTNLKSDKKNANKNISKNTQKTVRKSNPKSPSKSNNIQKQKMKINLRDFLNLGENNTTQKSSSKANTSKTNTNANTNTNKSNTYNNNLQYVKNKANIADNNYNHTNNNHSSSNHHNNQSNNYKIKPGAAIKIIPLGGLEKIGMNITAIEDDNSIIVIDCGLSFPTDDMPGIDLVIPDVTYLKQNRSKVKGFVITHGHEDHIGALPYILQELNVPVYGTRLTIELIKHKLEEKGLAESAHLHVVKHGETVSLGDMKVEFIKTNHSIQDASALAIFTPAGVVFATGDFKVDYTPIYGEAIDLQRMAQLGREGVLALLCESTNATKPGFTMSEKTVGRTFDIIFAEHTQNRIIVATFASNVDRVQQVINTAHKYGRKVVIEGRSMVSVIGTANELGYINIPSGTLIEVEQLKNYPPEKTVIITTGSQGESMAALSRMASGVHKKVSITPNDAIIMSSHPIPGNEKAVDNVINELSIKGAEVIFQDTHVSGHACAEELKLMYALLRPKYSIPVHGEYRHRKAQMEIAMEVGIPSKNVLMMSSGDVALITDKSCKIVDHVQAGEILVDGLGIGDVGNVVLRDRQNLAQNGIIIVTIALTKGDNQLVAGPELVTRGFIYIKDNTELLAQARKCISSAIDDILDRHSSDWGSIKTEVKDVLSDFFWKTMKRTPIILPIIIGV